MKNDHVKQRDTWDCGIACVAMLINKSYEDVLKVYKRLFPKNKKEGISDPEFLKLLKKFKINAIVIEAIVLGVPAIVTLPSKNEIGGYHVVYFDGYEILDPNYKIKGKKYYSKKIPSKFPKGTSAIVNPSHSLTSKALKKLR